MHWTSRLRRPSHCLRCGWKLGKDSRRRYCTEACFVEARRKYYRDRARLSRLKHPERYRGAVRKNRQRPEFYARQRILGKAKREGRKTGLSVVLILRRWGEPIGRVKGVEHAER